MMGFLDAVASAGPLCKQSAPHSRQITTPTPHHSIFTGRMLFLTPSQQCQSTEGKQDKVSGNCLIMCNIANYVRNYACA